MRIERIETFQVAPRWLLVRLETDDGHVGWGEASLEGHAEAVQGAIDGYTDLLIGQDAARIEHLWHLMTRTGFYRGGPVFGSAVSGIDHALWDIKGKALGVPVHELLGGPVRDSLSVYAPCHGDSPERLRDRAAELVDAGYRLMKISPSGPRERFDNPADTAHEAANAAAVREAIGDDRGFAVDFHGRLSLPSARRLLRELEPLAPTFVEEPVTPELQHELGTLTASTTVPIATGERLYDRWQVAPVTRLGISLLQPDLSHCHGISEATRIAAVASLHDIALAPHCATGPVAFAACVQFGFATHEVAFTECQLGLHEPERHPYLQVVDASAFDLRDGELQRPTGHGLGIEIDEERVRAMAAEPEKVPLERWRRRDGSHAEW